MRFRPPRIVRRVIALFTWTRRNGDMEREMAFHLAELAAEYERAGMTPAEAARAARARFGDTLRLRERGHDVRTSAILENLARDVRHAARGLRRSPGFTLAVILTLALGIGGNTAIFTVVDQLLLRPLPYPDGDQLVTIYETMPGFGFGPEQMVVGQTRNVVSPANWLDWQRDSRTLREFAAWRTTSWTLTGAGEPARLDVQLVSAEFFPLLRVPPLLGRTISVADDRPNAPLVAVLSYGFWQQRFGGDPAIVGRTIQVNDRPARVIGVMPAGFRFLDRDTAAWTAFGLERNRDWRTTAGRFMNVVARLRPGATVGDARAEMTGIAARLAATYEFNKHSSLMIVLLREELTGQVHSSLVMLYAAVAVLLAIACINVANLLLARGAARRRELAIRTSLGAGRGAIVRQLLVESVLLAVGGGVLGVLLARWSLAALVALAPPELLRVPTLTMDLRVLLYSLGLSMATGLAVGLVPAALVGRGSIVTAIRTGGAAVTHAPRVRQALVVWQVAMTVILLCGAGLLVRTLTALDGARTGASTSNLLTMDVSLPGARYDDARRVQFYRETVHALRALPGVEAAAAADSLAVIGDPRGATVFHRRGTPELPLSERPSATIRVVTPGYFRTMRIPVVRGREFTDADAASPAPGFVVNQAFASQFLSGVDPLATSISVMMLAENPYQPIIGVVGDVREGSVRDAPKPTVFYSHVQMPEANMTLLVRAARPASMTAASIAAIHRIDPNLAVTHVRTFNEALAESLARERLNAMVSGGFALSGLLLASVGLYGLLSFMVIERTREIGIRIALGASLGRVTRSVVAGGLRLVLAGAALGVAASFVLLRSLQSLLFGVAPDDPGTYAGVLALLGFVAALACLVPARRAARVEPLTALRQE